MSDSNIPKHLRYTRDHEWARLDGDFVWVGITQHAQAQLGDIVFLELPSVGAEFKAGEAFGVVESVKAVSDLYSPLDGVVEEVHEELIQSPDTLNTDVYEKGWLIKMRPTTPEQLDTLLDAHAYQEVTES